MANLADLARNWDAFADEDPFWAVCSDPTRKGCRWDPEAFFQSGREEINTVLEYLQRVAATPDPNRPVLDFGCGVGRLTQALSEHFELCMGVDISVAMIRLANQFNKYPDRCVYHVNVTSDLSIFSDRHFGFIYSSIVLQHIRSRVALSYIREFGRLLAPGGILVFQLADRSNETLVRRLRNRLRLGSRVRQLLAWCRLMPYRPFMELNHIPEEEIRPLIADLGLQLVDVQLTNSTSRQFNGRLRFLDREPERGEVSKQYCAVRRV
jgi:SAM-dependent methyltransferase